MSGINVAGLRAAGLDRMCRLPPGRVALALEVLEVLALPDLGDAPMALARLAMRAASQEMSTSQEMPASPEERGARTVDRVAAPRGLVVNLHAARQQRRAERP